MADYHAIQRFSIPQRGDNRQVIASNSTLLNDQAHRPEVRLTNVRPDLTMGSSLQYTQTRNLSRSGRDPADCQLWIRLPSVSLSQ